MTRANPCSMTPVERAELLALTSLFAVSFAGYLFSNPFTSSGQYRNVYLSAVYEAALLVAVAIGFRRARFFGGPRGTMGRVLFYITLGMLSFLLGDLAWDYYNLAAYVDVPYPSLADIAFLAFYPLVAYALMQHIGLMRGKWATRDLALAGASLLTAIVILSLILVFYPAAPQDFGISLFSYVVYPSMDILILLLVTWTLRLYGRWYLVRPTMVLAAGFVAYTGADIAYCVTTLNGTYFTGSWVDLAYLSAFFILGLGLHRMKPVQHGAHPPPVSRMPGALPGGRGS